MLNFKSHFPATNLRRGILLRQLILSSLFLLSGTVNAAMVAYYNFNASTTTDVSGNGRNLTAAGSPGLVTGKFGTALDLDGASHLWSADGAFNIGGADFALSFWYLADQDGFESMIGKSNSGSDQGYVVNLVSTTEVSGDFNDETGGDVPFTRPGSDNSSFQHVVFQRNGTNLEIYLNGILQNNTAFSGFAAGTNAFALGARNISGTGAANNGGTSQFFDGKLDEVRLYDSTLGTTEISNLYNHNSTSPPVSVPASSFSVKIVLALLIGLMLAWQSRKYRHRRT